VRSVLYPRDGRAAGASSRRTPPWALSLQEEDARGKVVQRWVNRLQLAERDELVVKTDPNRETIVELGAKADAETLAVLGEKVDALTAGTDCDECN
jgi:hypothetical protein